MNKHRVFSPLAGVCLFLALSGPASAEPETVEFDSDRWEISGQETRVEEHLGRTSVYLKGGIALLQDVQLTDGFIEFDISFTGERGFIPATTRPPGSATSGMKSWSRRS